MYSQGRALLDVRSRLPSDASLSWVGGAALTTNARVLGLQDLPWHCFSEYTCNKHTLLLTAQTEVAQMAGAHHLLVVASDGKGRFHVAR